MTESKRERYIRILSGLDGAEISAEACKELVELLKEPKMGKWLRTDDMYETLICSVCDYDTQDYIDYPYCPNCGAKMTI